MRSKALKKYRKMVLRDTLLRTVVEAIVFVGVFTYFVYTLNYWHPYPLLQILADAGVALLSVGLFYLVIIRGADRYYTDESITPELMIEAATSSGSNIFLLNGNVYCAFQNIIVYKDDRLKEQPDITYLICHKNLIGMKTWFLMIITGKDPGDIKTSKADKD